MDQENDKQQDKVYAIYDENGNEKEVTLWEAMEHATKTRGLISLIGR